MRVSLQWLKELVSAEPEAFAIDSLAERLSIAGFEVDGIDNLAARAAGVVVGYVQAREPHPNADKLSVCQVAVAEPESLQSQTLQTQTLQTQTLQTQTLQIVCGAANVRTGIHVPVALVGATLPAVGLTIKPTELRGVPSSGMICSLGELGLPSQGEGIAILEELLESVPAVGSPVGPLFGLDDQVLELAITANRPDGLSMQGIAREVAALVGGRTNWPAVEVAAASQPLPSDPASQRLMDEGGIFSITQLSGIQVAASPAWLQRRLEKAGLRPINNVVDITNLVMLETGQPLHAYDLDRLSSLAGAEAEIGSIGLRQAVIGETLLGLDGEQRQLNGESLLVTYAKKPIALAGLMGGDATAVRDTTKTIWLEAAVFPAMAVRRSAHSVGLRTEASSRFEKGLPGEVTLAAADRAAELLQQLAGALVEGRWLHRREQEPRQPLHLRRDALHNLLGPVLEQEEAIDLADERIRSTLEAIGCELIEYEEGWQVTVPPSRAIDLQREVDLIEEVARLVGYDQFACHLPDPIEPGGLEPAQQLERRLRRALTAAGLQECCSLSLVAAAPGRIPLANPLLADYGYLRDNLTDELLAAARRNLRAGAPGFWGFEIGNVFGEADAGASRTLLAGVICGERRAERWSSSGKPQPPSYFQARGLLQQALSALAVPSEDRPLSQPPQLSGTPLLHPGRSAQLLLEGRPAGWFGQLHPEAADQLDLPETTHLFELELAPLIAAASRRQRWQPAFASFATVPASERDLALVVPAGTTNASMIKLIAKAGKPLLEHVELIDLYSGAQLAEGQCSQAYRLRYRDPKRTLTDEEIESVHQKIRRSLEQQPGVQLRS
jgi:phenylalanyl-tRNA synthetase beta chain